MSDRMADSAAHPTGTAGAPLRPVYAVPSQRDTAYSYECNNCKRCCHDKLIQVNPYEVARLASHLQMSTGDFARNCLDDNVYLKRVANGACMFLNADGCGVHANRPMVCRIYPLGRHVGGDGSETFSHLEPHPQTAGIYGVRQTVLDYLQQQGAPQYMAAADGYLDLFHRLHAALVQSMAQTPQAAQDMGQVASAAKAQMPAWLDVDSVVTAYCAARGLPVPETVEGRMKIHITAIEEWLNQNVSTVA